MGLSGILVYGAAGVAVCLGLLLRAAADVADEFHRQPYVPRHQAVWSPDVQQYRQRECPPPWQLHRT